MLTEVNPTLDDNTLYNLLSAKCALGRFQMDVGSTIATHGKCIIDDDDISIHLSNNSNYSDNDDEELILDDIF